MNSHPQGAIEAVSESLCAVLSDSQDTTRKMALNQAVQEVLRAEFRGGVFRQIADAVMVADLILASMTEASTDTRDFFTDAPALVAAVLGAEPRIPGSMPALTQQPAAREALVESLTVAVGAFCLQQSPASKRRIDDVLRTCLSTGPWAELAITVGVTRKDVSRLATPKADQVCLLLNFAADALKDLSKPLRFLAPIEPEQFCLVSDRAA